MKKVTSIWDVEKMLKANNNNFIDYKNELAKIITELESNDINRISKIHKEALIVVTETVLVLNYLLNSYKGIVTYQELKVNFTEQVVSAYKLLDPNTKVDVSDIRSAMNNYNLDKHSINYNDNDKPNGYTLICERLNETYWTFKAPLLIQWSRRNGIFDLILEMNK